jgi:hypothetical protein
MERVQDKTLQNFTGHNYTGQNFTGHDLTPLFKKWAKFTGLKSNFKMKLIM